MNAPENSEAPEVMLVLPVLEPAGAERIVAELAKRLPRRGFATSVVCLEDEYAPIGAELTAAGVHVEGLRTSRRRTLACAKGLAQRIQARRPLIVHAHLYHANIAARLAASHLSTAQRKEITILSTVHVAERRFRPWQFMFDKSTAARARFEICVSHAVKRFQQERTGLPESFFHVIWNGIDLERYTAPDRPLSEPGMGRVLSVGRFDPQKDFPTLLRAWKIVEMRCPNALLTIAGDGPDDTKIRGLAANLLLRRVEFPGFVPDIVSLMHRADIYAQSSAWEGFGLAVAEAMACALPPVVTDADSLPELVTHDQTGLVVPAENPMALADALIRLLNDPRRIQELGDAAANDCLERFNVERMVDDYARLYNECLA